jgi:DNA-directed RNA polymerase III subunit RPC6
LEFDHEFITELRNFVLHIIKRSSQGLTMAEIQDQMFQAKISRVELTLNEVQQIVQTLIYDYKVEEMGVNEQGETLYVQGKRVNTLSEFKWWDAVLPDFHFRKIQFEDGIELQPHEPHYHT